MLIVCLCLHSALKNLASSKSGCSKCEVDRHPLYAPGNVIWTSRRQNVVAVVEWASNRLLWSWGQGELLGPHEGRVLSNGNVLIFDNGSKERGSRVIEVDPLTDDVVWEYKGESPEDFHTAGRGGAGGRGQSPLG